MDRSGDPQGGWGTLSRAEKEVVGLVQKKLTNPQIAARLYVSPRTVQTHLYNVFKKVGVRSRAELAAEATRREIAAQVGGTTRSSSAGFGQQGVEIERAQRHGE